MLVRFIISNHLSFREETELNLLTGSLRTLPDHIYQVGSDLEVLRTAALFGHGGAGKTSLLKALATLRHTLLTGRWDRRDWQPHTPGAPTHFEVEIALQDQTYAYGLAVMRDEITEEWLYRTHAGKDDELLFERRGSPPELDFSPRYLSSGKDQLRKTLYEEEVLGPNQPLLCLMAAAGSPFAEARAVWTWFQQYLYPQPASLPAGDLARTLSRSATLQRFVQDLLPVLDVGISELRVGPHSQPSLPVASEAQAAYVSMGRKSFHQPTPAQSQVSPAAEVTLVQPGSGGAETLIPFSAASDGTRALLGLLPALYAAMYQGQTVVIDGLGQGLHPALLQALVQVFSTQPTTGQLIFSTHETLLLDQSLLRRDEIWLIEKDPSGQSRLYPLSDFKIRYDLDIRKGYLNGRFGAVPRLQGLATLDWTAYAPEEPSL